MIGIAAWSPLVVTPPFKGPPKIAAYLEHMEYITDLVGVDHVGFGMDISEGMTKEHFLASRVTHPDLYACEYEERHPEGLENPRKLINITRGLVSKGYSDSDIEKIMGGNFFRICKQGWKKLI